MALQLIIIILIIMDIIVNWYKTAASEFSNSCEQIDGITEIARHGAIYSLVDVIQPTQRIQVPR